MHIACLNSRNCLKYQSARPSIVASEVAALEATDGGFEAGYFFYVMRSI